jgi:integrase
MKHRKPQGYLLENDRAPRKTERTGKGWNYRYNPRKTWLRISRLITAAGGKPITMYGMRHSFASNMLIARVTDVKVARWLGHADTRMLHRHYGHLLSYDSDINSVRFPVVPLAMPTDRA